jgi:hypothetical protein
MYRVWRALFGLAASRLVENVAAWCLRVLRVFGGGAAAESLIARFDRLFVYSGWPIHPKGWTNIHLSSFAWRLRRRLAGAAPVPARAVRAGKVVRIGFAGRFSGLLFFAKELFEAAPDRFEVFIFDIVYNGRRAEYLEPLVSDYMAADLADDYGTQLGTMSNAINKADLDVLLNVNWRADAFDLLDRVDTPCIINYCPGSDLLHHERVTLQLHSQPQADYFVVRNRMYCGLTRSTVGRHLVRSIKGFYDRRSLPLEPGPSWSDRKPLIVFHGALYKLASRPFLDVICAILQADRALEFVFMGREDPDAMRTIRSQTAGAGVTARVHYEGQFRADRSPDGTVADPGWYRLLSFLRDARLAPDPWPIGGGCSRLEAYIMGVPSVHMAVRFDVAALGKPQHAVIELPAMLSRLGTAATPADYHALCLKCLYDGAYAGELRAEQLAIARDLTDTRRWWQDLEDSYEDWCNSREPLHVAGAPISAAGGVMERRLRDERYEQGGS